jgi:hypothetical protein
MIGQGNRHGAGVETDGETLAADGAEDGTARIDIGGGRENLEQQDDRR